MSDQPLRIPLNETANFGPVKAMTETNWENLFYPASAGNGESVRPLR